MTFQCAVDASNWELNAVAVVAFAFLVNAAALLGQLF
jgi:hypothetical protein